MVNYGGDEVGAVVVDIGASSVRVGYAGDDAPKAVIPTAYGYVEEAKGEGVDVTMGEGDAAPKSARNAKLFVGQHGPSLWREGMHVGNPIANGIISDFNPIPALVGHAFNEVLRLNSAEHPILVTEPPWNTPANRERMAEIMFEEFDAPAFYIANTGVLNAFAAGKGTAFVIDIGRSIASVTPVVDGFVLRKGMQHSQLPDLVHAHARHLLTSPGRNRGPIALYSNQLIANKLPVEPGMAPQVTLREDRVAGTTQSWRTWSEVNEVDEWVQSMGGCLDQGWNEQQAASRPPRQYEFPTGYNTFFGPERYSVGEMFFFHSPNLTAQNPNVPRTLPTLINTSLNSCDPDLRQQLLGNVVVTGGGSLFSGLTERLNSELARHYPGVKIHAPGNPVERRYGGWLGGSILGSLGTFHQLWISKEEWQEHGKAIVGQRCK